MKKIYITLLTVILSGIVFGLPNTDGEINLKAGVNLRIDPDLREPILYVGTSILFSENLELEYLHPVYKINSKTDLKIGGGLQNWFMLYEVDGKKAQTSLKFSVAPVVSSIIEHNINDNTSIYGGASIGIGIRSWVAFPNEFQRPFKSGITYGIPIYGKFGVKYKKFLIELQSGVYISKFRDKNFHRYVGNIGVVVGYSF
ncbi:hypothetical protein [Oceanivirga salmonicida]|uniref:hypothetical protein n=1 Tax=Oceanivirga salmonicida TaxID=1769291 RepID=UPI000833BF94|nr:hypothetical protein [Oceanivirga salmonicida]